MRRCLTGLLVIGLTWGMSLSAAPVKVIFDTDMIGDYDDVGAMAVLHKLADAGECEILATVSSTHSNASVGTVELLNHFYGRGDIPVGAVKKDGVGGGSEHPQHRSHAKYEWLLSRYPGWWRHRNANDAPDATDVYRKALAAQPDGSVTIVTVGFLTNLRKLLESKPDAYSSLDGMTLVKAKVKEWYAMGWALPRGREYNIYNDAASAKYVLKNWPTKMIVDDFWFSVFIYGGRKVAALPDNGNPVRDIFARCIPPPEKCPSAAEIIAGGRFKDNVKEGHNCFDQSCVLAAVRGPGSFFKLVRGRLEMPGDKGENVWTPDPNGPHYAMAYLDEWPRERIAAVIDELMAAEPTHRAVRSAAAVVAARTDSEKTRGKGKRGWLAYEAERNQYFPPQNLDRVREIAAMLSPKAVATGDPVRYRAEWDALAATAEGKNRIENARKALKEPIAPLTLEVFEAYRRTGNRGVYKPREDRDHQLAALVWGECLENRGVFVAKIAELIEAICDEPSWVAPYEGGLSDAKKPLHGARHYIDLTGSARAAFVATVVSWMGEKLPAATRARAIDVMRGRIFETFLADSRRKGETTPYICWWMPDRFNWSAVCHNGCTTAILAVEDDPMVRAEAIEASERLMVPCFLDGFLADGYCEEGMGYWNYGFGNFLKLAATVKAQTNGKVDFCKAFPRAKLVAGFGAKYRMGHGSSPLFADGNGTADKIVLQLINMNWPEMYRAEVQGLSPFAGGVSGSFATRNFGPFKFTAPPAEKLGALPPRDWFGCAETLICRKDKLSFAIKGGSNGDRHNHNDAGSYLINVSDRAVTGDPGNENYNGRTFSHRRYESKVLNSFAHPVPRVGGELQGTGPAFGAKLLSTDFTADDDTIVYDLSGAYPAKVPIVKLVRTAVFDRSQNAIVITDEVEFAEPTDFESPVIAWFKAQPGKDRAHYLLPTGGKEKLELAITVEGGAWEMREEFVENPGRTQPYRMAIAFSKPVMKAKVRVRFALAEDEPQTPQMGVLTPPTGEAPRVNGPRVFGVTPGKPIFWYIPVTGVKPLEVTVAGLPEGAVYDSARRLVSGAVLQKGDYTFTVSAKNAKGSATRALTLKVGDTICLTPPLGWNSWNCWGQDVSDEKIRAAADAMVASGLADHGWSYVVVDDCWRTRPTEAQAGFKRPSWIQNPQYIYGPARLADGTPVSNSRFPDMAAMAAYLHAKGLRAGLYSVPSETSCCYTFGSWQNEAKDAETWAKWGYDLVKYDWCYGDRQYADKTKPADWQFRGYKLMGDLLAKQPRDIVYNVCNYGRFDVLKWAKKAGGHYWRTNDDLKDTWRLLLRSIDANLEVADYAAPGGWNDPDMLVVGPMRSNGFTKSRLTPNEQYTHISLWAIMATPLFIGCDMARLGQDPLALSLLTNDEVLDINQDELGKVGRPVVHNNDFDIWARPLADGSWAFALFNRTGVPRRIGADFSTFCDRRRLRVRDVWAQKDVGTFENRFEAEVYGHATRLFRAFAD